VERALTGRLTRALRITAASSTINAAIPRSSPALRPTSHAPQLPPFSGVGGCSTPAALPAGAADDVPLDVCEAGGGGEGAVDDALALGIGGEAASTPLASGPGRVEATSTPDEGLHHTSVQTLAPRERQRCAKPRPACCFTQASGSA